jgi:rRNA processing protein Krr1/Pno1
MMSDESTKRERDENHNSSSLSEEDEFPETKKIKLEGASDEDTVLDLTNSAPPELDSGAYHNSFTEPTSLDEREDDNKCIADIQSKLKNNENDPSVLEDKVYVEEQPEALRNDESAFHSMEGRSTERIEDNLENIQEDSSLSQSQNKELNAEPNEPISLSNPNTIVEERGEISAQYVGKVIGKGGEMLRDLQARSGCRLDVDQNVPHGHPRILTYRGTRKKVDLAKQMVGIIVTLIHFIDRTNNLLQVATLCTPQGNETTLPLGSATRKDLAVPATAVGKIIGRSGEMVRELQSRSQAKIQVDHTAKGFKADTRLVSIVGTPEAVLKAEEMISFLVANPLLDAMKAIKMLVEDKMHRGGKWGSGPPYLNMPNQGQNMTPVDSSYNQQQPVAQHYGAPPFHTAGPSTGHGFVVPSQLQFGGYIERIQETEYFPAAKIYMGRIIGQKGVTINDLQKRSGCDIQINQDVPPGSDCIITIKGFRQSIEIAKQMLREIIEMGPDHPYAGGGGRKSNSMSFFGMSFLETNCLISRIYCYS